MRERLSLLGIDMTRRVTRRSLVTLTYLVLAFWCALVWTQWGYEGQALSVVLASALLVNALIFGRYARGGLIKPFATHTSFGTRTSWQNDERELRQRDRMHFYAYRVVLALILLGFFLGIDPFRHLEIGRAFVVLGIVLGLTLPQALLLWSEADVDAARD